ncbi:MAG: serine hydrolase domain-containing protein [Balneolaceae bacterium]|nr:serine hydrolase domain-containing protein [Balneolaceae bacterium]
MTKRRKITLGVLGIPLLGLFALLISLYPKFAEDVPSMRPFGWIDLPETRPYTEREIAPGYREAADRARDLLRDHVRDINVPAFSAAIAVDGKLVWSAATGYADVEQKRKATPNTLFRIGSTSKAVTGTLFARMVDDRAHRHRCTDFHLRGAICPIRTGHNLHLDSLPLTPRASWDTKKIETCIGVYANHATS